MEKKQLPERLVKVLEILTAFLKAGLAVLILEAADYAAAFAMIGMKIDLGIYKGVYSLLASALSLIGLYIFSRVEGKITNGKRSDLIKFNRISVQQALSTITIAFALLAVVTTYMMLVRVIGTAMEPVKEAVGEYDASMQTYDTSSPYPLWDQLLYVVGLTFFVPAAEEFAFRGLIYGSINRSMNVAWSIGISSVIFGVMHGLSVHIGYALMSGIILGLSYYAFDSVFATILIHGIFNFFGSGIYNLCDALGVDRQGIVGLYTMQFVMILPAGMLLAHYASARYKMNGIRPDGGELCEQA
ncbi:CAAX protease self-immunity [Ruminococcaceae bacterium YRB3002]|nr:CAAX protease self-immunity [Ruminococcaceae bacterium YRB3002]